MENSRIRLAGIGSLVGFMVLVASGSTSVLAQVNSWINPGSGNWEDQSSWSLGVLPNSAQSVALTNAGWKAVAITAHTAQNFPQSMQIQGLRLASPTNSFNELLLNFAGFTVPLQVTSLNVGSNSTLVLQSSLLQANADTNGNGGYLDINGTVQQGDFAQVRVQSLAMWDPVRYASDVLPPATYFLTNGLLSVNNNEYLGGMQGPARFVEYGGEHDVGSLDLEVEGEFDLYGGQLTATNGITAGSGDYADGAYFNQYGGNVYGDLSVGGNYFLSDGTITGHVTMGLNERSDGYMTQTGGSIFASSMELGRANEFGGGAFYTLSNGVIHVDASVAFGGGSFNQFGGQFTIVSNLITSGSAVEAGVATGDYYLHGGTLSSGGQLVALNSTFHQDGGTNMVGDLTVAAAPIPQYYLQTDAYNLTGGFLVAQNEMVNAAFFGGFNQTGGTNQIAQALTLQGSVTNAYYYTMQGGTLAVRDINISAGAFFQHTSGNIIQSGLLTLNQGEWRASTNSQALGPLELAGANTNSAITFPDGSSILKLADSSAQAWDPSATLSISNWHGSVSGGGATELYFGSNASGLTAQQLSQVRFIIGGGVDSAQILSTGEVVPSQSLTTSTNINNWLSTLSGRWDSAADWSLAVLPAAGQTVNITNAGYKAVVLDAATLSGAPGSLTVSNLSVSAPTNASSTLLLDAVGLGTPLKVRNGCYLGTNGLIANSLSSFEVDGTGGGQFLIDGGIYTQTGGQAVVTAPISVNGGSLNDTNGNMTLGAVTLGTASSAGTFNQQGGSIAVASLSLSQGSYNLYDGILYMLGGTDYPNPGVGKFNQYGGTNYGDVSLDAGYPGAYRLFAGLLHGSNIVAEFSGSFCQSGGVAESAAVTLNGVGYQMTPNYFLTNGILRAGTLSIHSSEFLQMNGQVVITNPLSLFAYDVAIPHVGIEVFPANYTMQAGSFTCPSMTVTQYVNFSAGSFASFTQTGGTNLIANDLNLADSTYTLDGGAFLRTSTTLVNSGALFQHQDGTNEVTGLLSVAPGGQYLLGAGTLSAGAISMHGLLAIGTSNALSTVSCAGLLDLAGSIQIQAGTPHLGTLELTGNSDLNLGGGPATINFDSSSSVAWSSGATLSISNWTSSGTIHIFFGNNASALTASQLAQIQFLNPGGYPAATYGAQLLATGELVPASSQPVLQSARYGSAFVLSWPSGYQLLSATNVTGPYSTVNGATSPWTNSLAKPQEFFKLQGP